MPGFTDLPYELFTKITEPLGRLDKLRLSSTVRSYRSLLAPEIFESIRVTNDDSLAASALYAAKHYGEYTRRLEVVFRATAYDSLTAPVLPHAAVELLQGKHMPNLCTVDVAFDFDFDSGSWDSHLEHSIYVFEANESREYVKSQEGQRAWRALMNDTWAALAMNHSVKDLRIRKFLPKWTTAFETAEFCEFLGRLEVCHHFRHRR